MNSAIEKQIEELNEQNRRLCLAGIDMALERVMLLRQHIVLDGLTAAEIDEHIASKGAELMQKYGNMGRSELMFEMLMQMKKSQDHRDEIK